MLTHVPAATAQSGLRLLNTTNAAVARLMPIVSPSRSAVRIMDMPLASMSPSATGGGRLACDLREKSLSAGLADIAGLWA